MLRKSALIFAICLTLAGCSSAQPEPAQTLYGGMPVPSTADEVIEIVAGRYSDCFEQLGGATYSYAPDGSDLIPGNFLAQGDGWTVLITVSPITAKGVLPTVPGSEKSIELLSSVGC